MSYAKGKIKRSTAQKVFLILFVPSIIFMYLIYKHADWFVSLGLLKSIGDIYFFGKSPSFWYVTLYTAIVCGIAGRVLWQNSSPYKKGKNNQLSSYQKKKFWSIFLVQLVLLYLLPYYIVPLSQGKTFFADVIKPTSLDAYIYVAKGFTSKIAFLYVFILIPISVYFFGKKYCSWFCACGNLAETVGVTKWGSDWVKYMTPTGMTAKGMESLQTFFLLFGLSYGFVLFLDVANIITASTLLAAGKLFQDLVVDLLFGALIGVSAYPFLGTRIWCRYGCPMAKMMELIGRFGKTRFEVAANDKCKGINICSQVCPMGIDVASFAHKDKKPILGSFGLDTTPCIGCGGCVDICPVDALIMK